MTINEDIIIALYDGGWRKGDIDELINSYEFKQDEAEEVAYKLEELEEKLKNA